MTPAARLREAGFTQVGRWTLNGASLIPEMRPVAPDGSRSGVLYAFFDEATDEVLYVGKSVRSLRRRLYGYQNPGPTQRTNQRLNQLMIERLRAGNQIGILAFYDDQGLTHGGLRVSLVAGLEDSIIRTLRPTWNMTGK